MYRVTFNVKILTLKTQNHLNKFSLKLLHTRISEICSRGFVGLSNHTSFVRGLIADETSAKSEVLMRLLDDKYHN